MGETRQRRCLPGARGARVRVTASMVDAREAVEERRSASALQCTTLSASRSRMRSSLTEHSCAAAVRGGAAPASAFLN